MPFHLHPLPYAEDALEPDMSAETLRLHYGKHHAGYVAALNDLVRGTPRQDMALEDVVRWAHDAGEAKIFDNAAQAWSHAFFWDSMTPEPAAPPSALAAAIERDFGSLDALKDRMVEKGAAHFASGWLWLVAGRSGLEVVDMHDAMCPLVGDGRAILVCDLWEHAYYVDRRNDRTAFLRTFVDRLADWTKAAERLAA